jgi:AraC-like DNA-binding protein
MPEMPQTEWTAETLAERSACSRSVLAERFKAVIGEAPMHYLGRLRLHHAARRLSDGGGSLETIADEIVAPGRRLLYRLRPYERRPRPPHPARSP